MKHFLLLLAFVATALPGRAGGFRIVPGAPLAGNDTVLEAHGRQGWRIRQKLHFGEYRTTDIRRSLIRKWSGATGVPGAIWVEQMQGRQSIRFTLTDGVDTMHSEAVSRVRSTDLIIGNRPNSLPNIMIDVLSTGSAAQQNNYSAAFTTTAGKTYELFLDNTAAQLRRSEAAGFLAGDSSYYAIVPVWKVERKGKTSDMLFGAAGLEFRDEAGQTVAAVSLMNKGEVHLAKDGNPADKLLFAAAATALLLQDPIE